MNAKNYDNQLFTRLNRLRNGIIGRCTKPEYDNYRYYGQKGVTVCDTWIKSFDAFYLDVTHIQGWDEKEFLDGKITLDKDLKKMQRYSKESCVWLSHQENINLRGNNVYFVVTPEGDKLEFSNITQFCREYNLHYNSVTKRLNGSIDNPYYKMWYIPKQKESRYTPVKKYEPPFYIKNIDTLEELEFSSIKEIALFLDVAETSVSHIRNAINPDKNIKSFKGYLVRDSSRPYKSYTKKRYICHFPDGTQEVTDNITELCKKHGFNLTCVSECLHGKQETHKNHRFELIEEEIS